MNGLPSLTVYGGLQVALSGDTCGDAKQENGLRPSAGLPPSQGGPETLWSALPCRGVSRALWLKVLQGMHASWNGC